MSDLLAHGVGIRGEVPLEAWHVAWIIVVAVMIAFVSVSRRPLDPPRHDVAAGGSGDEVAAGERSRYVADRVGTLGPAAVILRASGLAGLMLVLAAGALGSTTDGETIAPVLVWTVTWAWLPILAMIVGDPWVHLSPFDTLARLAGAPQRRSDPAPAWSHWLAPLGMGVFAATELAHPHADSAQLIAGLVGAYTLAVVGGAWWWGRDWLARAETLAVYLGALGALAPLRRDGAPATPAQDASRRAIDRAPTFPEGATFVIALGALLWDAVGDSDLWRDFIGPAEGWVTAWWRLLGLADVVAVVAVAALLAARLVSSVARRPLRHVAPELAPVLVPLVAGATVAHFGQVAVDGVPALLRSLSDPFGGGADLLGGIATELDQTWLAADLVAWVQVVALVLGAIGAVVVGDRCVRALVHTSTVDLMRAQYGVVFFVAAYTVISAWFLLA